MSRCSIVTARTGPGVVIATVLAAGCVGLGAGYPDEWEPLYAGDDLEARIVGWYDCQGDIRSEHTGTSAPRSLGRLILVHGCDALHIDRPRPGHLRLSFHYGPGRPIPTVIDLELGDGYRVSDRWITLDSEGEFKPDAVVSGWTSAKPALALTESGNLVASRSEKTLGLLVIVPFAESSRDWGIFPRITEPEMSQEDRETYEMWLDMDED
jgi:hypothetical protein